MATTSKPAPDINVTHSIAADLGEQYEEFHGVKVLDVPEPDYGAGVVAVVPRGKHLQSLKPFIDEFRERPERRSGVARLQDADSFVAFVNRFKDGHSAIFADASRTSPSLTAVLDYNQSGVDGMPRFGKHRAVYQCPLSDEWMAWTRHDGKPLAQGDFASFLEDHITDVMDPAGVEGDENLTALTDLLGGRWASASTLIGLSRGLQINIETAVKQAVTLSTGEITVNYAETHSDGAGAPIRVPNLFLLAIPVFRGGAFYRVPVRLRYRLSGGKLSWSFHLYRADRVFDDAFSEVVTKAATGTALTVFMGAPEV